MVEVLNANANQGRATRAGSLVSLTWRFDMPHSAALY
jgi:hypothetical protein